MPVENNQTPLSFGVFVIPSNREIKIDLLHQQGQSVAKPFKGEHNACNVLVQSINGSLSENGIASSFGVEKPITDVGGGFYIACTTFVGFQDFEYGRESLADRPEYDSALKSAKVMCSRLNALQITVDEADFANAVRAR